MRWLRPAAAPLALAVAGCVGLFSGPEGEEALAKARSEAVAIDRRLDGLASVSGPWQRGEVESTWRAWFEEGEILLIRERMRLGGDSARDARYYYEDGELSYYVAEGRWPAVGPDGGRKLADVRHEIAFDGAGREIASQQVVSGLVAPIEPSVIVAARRHAAEIEAEAEARLAGEPVTRGS